MNSIQKLFTPIQIGAIRLSHRVVMPPLSPVRSKQPGDIPGALMAEYYTQRASDGGLIITESASVAMGGRAY
jgi:N-ethylmaleimide reductase